MRLGGTPPGDPGHLTRARACRHHNSLPLFQIDIPCGTPSPQDEHQTRRIKSRSVRGSATRLPHPSARQHQRFGEWGGALLPEFARKERSDEQDGELTVGRRITARAPLSCRTRPRTPDRWSAPPLPVRRKLRRRARRREHRSPPPPAGATSPSVGRALVFQPLGSSVATATARTTARTTTATTALRVTFRLCAASSRRP